MGSKNGHNLAETHNGWLAFFAFIGAAMWINLVAGVFMDFLSMIQIVANLPLTYLSLTMLAWGNSLDDFFIDYVIAKNGNGKMAVTGVYGGQLFNLLIGFGGSMFRHTLTYGAVPIDLYKETGIASVNNANTLIAILIYSNLAGAIFTLIMTSMQGWKMGRFVQNAVLIFYVGFLAVVTFFAFA
mmetsp:Transcript_26101/g.36594  ORF Transcript_26101/g.36594 Transcript_26101/m.36594 type:complete len:184 (-) Transcript_26101:184-735(-)